MTLDAEVGVDLGSLRLDLALRVAEGETAAVVGPNGAGKTTLLRALAGLVALDRGHVSVDGAVLAGAGAGIDLPPERRPVGMVFQDHRLFPHLTAVDNVAYGLRRRGIVRPEARRVALTWLERVGLGDRAGARPGQLSGGQAQRVALARALAVEPRLLLLDEPLAAVDALARPELRRVVAACLAAHRGTRLLVTHDPVEAMTLARRLVVVEAGRVVQDGPVDEVVARPRSPWAAEMAGVNLLRGTAEPGAVVLPQGFVLVAVTEVRGDAFAAMPPRAVALHRERPGGSARNVWPGTVETVDALAERVRVRVTGPVVVVAEVTRAAAAELELAPGAAVWVAVKATEVSVYAA